MEQSLNERLNEVSIHFSKSQRALANYIVEHCDKAAFLTANKLGEAVGVSESTVVRFAVRLGYEGYPEMQRAVQELIRNRLTAVQRLDVTASLLEEQNVLRSVMREDIDRISTTLNHVDPAVFDDAVHRILSAKRIYIIGLRSSSALAEFLYFYFNLIFDDVRILTSSSSSVLSEQLLRAEKGDAVIGISFPRYSRMTVDALEYAHSRGADVIAITDSPVSPLQQHADCALYAESDTASFVDSLVAPMSLINALVVAAGMHRREALRQVFGDLENIWDKYEVYRKTENR
ncbi:MAG: MurR/RpiR family transcriptional regulator [Ruminococcaceae bacterium]|nr:MurR/RpiR family transcriptional regulator [Oscillospiraceae bacterium]